MDDLQLKLRAIPGIDRLLAQAATRPALAGRPHHLLAGVLREAVDGLRRSLADNAATEVSAERILADAEVLLDALARPGLRRVVNATGVVLHTNLGRAPLSFRAQQQVAAVMAGYSTLEYAVATGERGSRYEHVAKRLCGLTGAEAALVVNNNAAAVLLVLSALAVGREVIVSRGQLVEIGGSFRVPDVLKQSGAILVEVGTTNKTHLKDYETAIGPNTAAILKVHTSNFRLLGFTSQPDDAALVGLAKAHNVPIIEDLGSGTLLPVDAEDWHEPTVGEKLAAGIDVVTFSGDKLFGGAQAGIIAGNKALIEKMKPHPLLRALRVDKLSLAALEGTLLDYVFGNPQADIPAQRMLHMTPDELGPLAETLARRLGQRLPAWEIKVVSLQSQAGGGSLPAVNLASRGVSLRSDRVSTTVLAQRLRLRPIPIIVRLQEDRLIFDVRCLAEDDFDEICEACTAAERGSEA